MRFVRLTAEHIIALGDVASHKVSASDALDVEEWGGWAGIDDNKLIGCGGIIEHPQWRGTGLAWTIMLRDWRKYARVVTHWVELELVASRFNRIEATCEADNAGARRWLERLGFELEADAMRGVADGKDHALYARIRDVEVV